MTAPQSQPPKAPDPLAELKARSERYRKYGALVIAAILSAGCLIGIILEFFFMVAIGRIKIQ